MFFLVKTVDKRILEYSSVILCSDTYGTDSMSIDIIFAMNNMCYLLSLRRREALILKFRIQYIHHALLFFQSRDNTVQMYKQSRERESK